MEYICIGKIVDTHGIKGELRIRSNFDKKDIVFKPGFIYYIGDDKIREEVVTYRHHKEFEMVTFKGYDNINQVLKYIHLNVYVLRDDMKLGKDDYVLDELVNLEVIKDGKSLGIVREIVYNNSNVLLRISAIKDFYIPYNEYFIKRVDLLNKKIEVDNIEGLIL